MKPTAIAFAAVLLSSATAAAEPMVQTQTPAPAESIYAFGMRVGGYGFRAPEADAAHRWSDCRMNGVGIFGDRRLGKSAFVEAGTDVYFADNTILSGPSEENQGMDRLSGLLTVAAGLRMAPGARLSGYAEVGTGMELTRVSMDHGDPTTGEMMTFEKNYVFPVGFVGFGGDIKLTARLRAGASLRTYLMAHFDHESGDMNPEPEAANQGQFYLRYSL